MHAISPLCMVTYTQNSVKNQACEKQEHVFNVLNISPHKRLNGTLNAVDVSHNESTVQLVRLAPLFIPHEAQGHQGARKLAVLIGEDKLCSL